MEALQESLLDGKGSVSGILNKLLSGTSSMIKGENMIFPQIYQSSEYSKSYSITVDLRTPYGSKLSYYLNIVVPLMHLLCLAIPKQTTANTYGSPFLVKVYYPGVFTCNLGIVQSIQIDKNVTGDSWTVDGFPNHVKVTLNIIDLYSDLSMSKSGDITLFLSNSSLIEYLATNCGVNLITPQLKNRVEVFRSVISQAFDTDVIKESVTEAIFGGVSDWVNKLLSITGV